MTKLKQGKRPLHTSYVSHRIQLSFVNVMCFIQIFNILNVAVRIEV